MRVNYTDQEGFQYLVEVPAGYEDEPELGIIVGPPHLESLNLPKEYELKLNQQLFERQLFTWSDVRRRPDAIKSALKAAFRVSEAAIVNLYREGEK